LETRIQSKERLILIRSLTGKGLPWQRGEECDSKSKQMREDERWGRGGRKASADLRAWLVKERAFGKDCSREKNSYGASATGKSIFNGDNTFTFFRRRAFEHGSWSLKRSIAERRATRKQARTGKRGTALRRARGSPNLSGTDAALFDLAEPCVVE